MEKELDYRLGMAGTLLEEVRKHPMAKFGAGLLLVQILDQQQAVLRQLVAVVEGGKPNGG